MHGFAATDRRFRSQRSTADYGPSERWNHSGRQLEPTERAGILAARAIEECMLDVLLIQQMISTAERDAGLRLRQDFHAAGLEARVAGSYNPARGSLDPFSAELDRTDAEEAAYQRWRSAVRALGITCSDAVISVTCHDTLPAPHQRRLVKSGLVRLAKWYGIF